jgi:hypothetical protein
LKGEDVEEEDEKLGAVVRVFDRKRVCLIYSVESVGGVREQERQEGRGKRAGPTGATKLGKVRRVLYSAVDFHLERPSIYFICQFTIAFPAIDR